MLLCPKPTEARIFHCWNHKQIWFSCITLSMHLNVTLEEKIIVVLLVLCSPTYTASVSNLVMFFERGICPLQHRLITNASWEAAELSNGCLS